MVVCVYIYIYIYIYIYQCYFLNSSYLLLPTLCTKICSLREDLYSCPTNRFISTIFLDSMLCYAKSLQSCPTLCNPPGSPVPGTLQARTLEWVAISFSNSWKWKVKVKSLSRVRLSATPWTAAYQAPPSMGFSRQEYWSGVPLPLLFSKLHQTFVKSQWQTQGCIRDDRCIQGTCDF